MKHQVDAWYADMDETRLATDWNTAVITPHCLLLSYLNVLQKNKVPFDEGVQLAGEWVKQLGGESREDNKEAPETEATVLSLGGATAHCFKPYPDTKNFYYEPRPHPNRRLNVRYQVFKTKLGKTSNLDGVIMKLGFVKNTGFSAFLVAMLVVAPQVWAETFTAKVVGVSDGDTVKVLTEQSCDSGKDCRSGKVQYRVRLAEIDTPEKKQPYGSKAKEALSDLVFGRMIKVEQIDKDRYGRLVANLYVDGKWVNAEMVRSGSAWVYRQYAKTPELFKLEAEAKADKRGLWALPESERTPPWEWRRKH